KIAVNEFSGSVCEFCISLFRTLFFDEHHSLFHHGDGLILCCWLNSECWQPDKSEQHAQSQGRQYLFHPALLMCCRHQAQSVFLLLSAQGCGATKFRNATIILPTPSPTPKALTGT